MATKAATPKAENIETVEKAAKTRLQDTRETLGHVGKALNQSGRAYYAGIMELGRFAGGVGREVVSEAGEHLRATVRAKSVREAVELQASYVQHRIEMSATHGKEFIDVAYARTQDVIAPVTDLVTPQDKAA